jgi:hypothetical protein
MEFAKSELAEPALAELKVVAAVVGCRAADDCVVEPPLLLAAKTC